MKKRLYMLYMLEVLLFTMLLLPWCSVSAIQESDIEISQYDLGEGSGYEDISTHYALWLAGDSFYIEPSGTSTYSEPYLSDEFYSEQWALEATNASAVWENDITGNGVRICVIDSGIAMDHEDIDYDFIDMWGRTEYAVADMTGHGTMVTGVICAIRDNDVGIAGILERATIIPQKGTGPRTLVYAIYDAIDVYHCDVINMSFAFPEDDITDELREAIAYAASKNVIMVAGVGNGGESAVLYPAGFDEVIGVGSIDPDGGVSDFSQHNSSVFVTAPGRSIVTTALDGYATVSGTSIATPHVTALAAVAKSVRHDMTVEEFKDLLIATSVDAGEPGYDEYYGHGVIDFAAFIDALPESNWILGFRDISGHWALEGIEYAVELGLFTGTTSYSFSPDQEMTRAMLVTALGRLYEAMGGTVADRAADDFIDTRDNTWYSKYVVWATEEGIVEGYGDGRFGPDDPITREQMVELLYRFSPLLDLDTLPVDPTGLGAFADGELVSGWALASMPWAIEKSLIQGIEEDGALYIRPAATATRAQVATILQRFCGLMDDFAAA